LISIEVEILSKKTDWKTSTCNLTIFCDKKKRKQRCSDNKIYFRSNKWEWFFSKIIKLARVYLWPAVNKRPTRLWPKYLLTWLDEIFFVQTQTEGGWPEHQKIDSTLPRSKIFDPDPSLGYRHLTENQDLRLSGQFFKPRLQKNWQGTLSQGNSSLQWP